MDAFATVRLGIDVKYLSSVAVNELGQIDDIARKASHLRRMIQRTQDCLRAVDKVTRMFIFYSVGSSLYRLV
jgi:hypothetical protein